MALCLQPDQYKVSLHLSCCKQGRTLSTEEQGTEEGELLSQGERAASAERSKGGAGGRDLEDKEAVGGQHWAPQAGHGEQKDQHQAGDGSGGNEDVLVPVIQCLPHTAFVVANTTPLEVKPH